MIRIVFVIPTLDQSGAERQLVLLACGLPREEYDVHVIALNRGGPYASMLREHDIPLHVLGKRFRFDFLTWWRLRSLLRRLQPAIVQSFIFAANSYVRLKGICPPTARIIVSERCVDSWKSGWQKSIDRRLASRMKMMTANSDSVSKFYRNEIGLPGDLIRVIPNGVPIPERREPGSLHRELGLPEDCRVVGFIGRLAPQKNLKDLVWAFHLIRQAALQPVALVLIGAGPERDALAAFLSDLGTRHLVHFMGHRSDASQLLQDFSVFCLPSAFEGMSNSLMESMAAGVPCVVSDIAPNRELVEHEQTGLIFPTGKAPELARAVLRLLNDANFSNDVGAAAQQHMATHFSVDTMICRHRELYNELLSHGPAESVPETAEAGS